MPTNDSFAKRRKRLLRQMRPGVAIFPAAHETVRSNDTEYPFRQDSDFHYLTGFPEPDAIAVLRPGHPKPYVLFVRERDREKEIWTGFRQGVEGARERFGADEAYPLSEWPKQLPKLLQTPRVYLALGKDARIDQQLIAQLKELRRRGRQGAAAPGEVVDPSPVLAEMRLFKSADEMPLLRRAAALTAAGHIAAMKHTRPGMYEYEVQALVEHAFRQGGASAPGYNSIVAGGANATILHYVENAAPLDKKDLLLIDAGAEYAGYSGDVTRTFPVGGRFTGAARAVYEVVLAAQEAAIRACKPGMTLEKVHRAACRVLVEGLVELKVLRGDTRKLLENEAYRPYYMHRTSHWLGLDVHDAGAYFENGKPRLLQPGMVLTVEPGLYFHHDVKAPQRLKGIGVRIEDDILITRSGAQNLTAAVPKKIDDIETLRREAV